MTHQFMISSAAPVVSVPPRGRSLCPLIMVGDPNIASTHALLEICAESGVAMVELCVPFSNTFTDGATLRRAHQRALEAGAGLDAALALIRAFSDRMSIILLADSSHTLRPRGFSRVCAMARDAGAAAILPHGLPPRLAQDFHEAASGVIPVAGTVYAHATSETRRQVIQRSSAFIYLVSAYGRSGGGMAADLSTIIGAMRAQTSLPIAIGFGLKTPAHVAAAFRMGCDIAIVGSAVSAAVEQGLSTGDPVGLARDLIGALNAETRR